MKKLALLFLLLSVYQLTVAQTVIEKNGKYGIQNENGSMLLPANYFQIIPLDNGAFLLCQENPAYNGVAGIAKHKVEPIGISTTSLSISCSNKSSDFSFNPNLRYGLSGDSDIFLPAKYQEVRIVDEGEMILVKMDGKYYGINNKNNKPIKKSEMSELCVLPDGMIVKNEGKYGIMTFDFKYKHKPIYDEIKQIKEEVLLLTKGADKILVTTWGMDFVDVKPFQEIYPDSIGESALIKRNGKYGVIEIYEGNEEVPVIYSSVEPIELESMLKASKDGKYGLISNMDNQTYLPLIYDDLAVLNSSRKLIKTKTEGKWQAMIESDFTFNKVGKAYDDISLLSETKDDFFIIKENNLLGIADKFELKEIHSPQFSSIKAIKGYFEVDKDGKKGLLSTETLSIILSPEYDEYKLIQEKDFQLFLAKKQGKWGIVSTDKPAYNLPFEYDNLSFIGNPNWVLTTKNGKKGLLWFQNNYQEVIKPDYEDLKVDVHEKGCLAYAKKGGKWGILDVQIQDQKASVKTIQDFIVEEMAPIEGEGLNGYVKMKKRGLFGLYKMQTDVLGRVWMEVLPAEFEDISYESKLTVRVKKRGKSGSATLSDGHILYLNNMKDIFPLKWKTPIGQSTFRTNLMFAKGVVLAGSNGKARGSLKDDQDGLYLIDPKTGKVSQHFQPNLVGDTDVNGVAVSGNYIYFGNDNDQVFCYSFSGDQIWKASVDGDIEGSPTLFDSNGDGIDDAIFATENGSIMAFEGKTGTKLWEYKTPNGGYFTATPAAYDINNDGTADVLIGTGGSPYFYAINGKTGEELWQFKTKSTAGFVNGSAIHASASILIEKNQPPYIIATECYGIIHYLDLKGQWKRYIGNTIGIFSTPVFSPKGTIVNGAAWLGRGNVDVTLIRGLRDWEEQRGGVKYVARRTQMDGSPVGLTSSSAFVADVLGNGSSQIGIADETGKCQLINEDGTVAEIMLLPAGVEAPMLVQDIDGDGLLEIVVACLDGNLYCYDTRSRAQPFWGQFRGNNKNTGVIKYD